MDILVRGLLSVGGQCQVAKDASNFCSEWVSVSVFTLIVSSRVFGSKVTQEEERGLANARPLSPIFEVLAHGLFKGFDKMAIF